MTLLEKYEWVKDRFNNNFPNASKINMAYFYYGVDRCVGISVSYGNIGKGFMVEGPEGGIGLIPDNTHEENEHYVEEMIKVSKRFFNKHITAFSA